MTQSALQAADAAPVATATPASAAPASEPAGNAPSAASASLPPTPPAAPAVDPRQTKLVISLLLVSAFVVILNETIMSVALPHLMADLAIPASSAQWVTTAFLLTMATVIPISGFLLQRLNTRPVFLLAMSLFTAGTLICAVAPGFAFLVVGRVVQASGTAVMMPLLITTIMTLVPVARRGATMGSVSIVISVAPAIGPTVSGLILSVLNWRYLFVLVLPIAIAALALGAARIPNVGRPRDVRIDVLSVLLAPFGFGGVVYGLSNLSAVAGAEPAIPAGLALAVGVVALLVFGFRQIRLQRHDRALLDLRTFRSGNFAIGVATMATGALSLFGTLILLPIYLQNVSGLSTLQTGLFLMPGALLMGIAGRFVGRLYDKHGTRPLVVPGAIIVSVALWVLTSEVGPDTSVAVLLPAHIVLMGGLSLMFTPIYSAALGSLPARLTSYGSATVSTIQQVSGAAGTALFIAVMTGRSATLAAGGADEAVALAGGIKAAFLCGAVISLLAIVGGVFVRKPPAPVMAAVAAK